MYRALEHGTAKKSCQYHATVEKFPEDIQDFANRFAEMQTKRHLADYDPHTKVTKSSVLVDLKAAEDVIGRLKKVPLKDRRAFAAYVLLKRRT